MPDPVVPIHEPERNRFSVSIEGQVAVVRAVERQVLRVEDVLHDIQGVVGNVDLFGSGCIHQGFTFLLRGRDSRPANER